MPNNKQNTYFISDIHLGLPNHKKSLVREKLLVKFLNEIKEDAKTIYFVGDIFDFWWEYKYVVPKGYVRFLGKIAEMSDAGIEIIFFTGNHDVWMKDYLSKELGIKIYHKEIKTEINGKKFFIAHGDGLGKGDNGYKLLKIAFTSKFLQWCYTRLHPNFAFGLGNLWSQTRRKKEKTYRFKGLEKEILVQFAKNTLKEEHFDFLIFGHRHFPAIIELNDTSKYANIGDWLINFTFLKFNGETLAQFSYKNGKIESHFSNLRAEYKIDIF